MSSPFAHTGNRFLPEINCQDIKKLLQEIQRITGDGRGWVDTPPEAPLFSSNGSTYVTIGPVKDGAAGYYKHIISVNVLRKQEVPLTHGKFEVVKILVWDQANNTM